MGKRRMFSRSITDSAKFLKMPAETQALYFHLCLHADDDGIVEAFTIMRTFGSSEDNIRILNVKGFITILNEDLVSYIMDRNEHNLLRSDRKINSIYQGLLLKVLPGVEILEPKERSDRKPKPLQNQGIGNIGTSLGQPMDRLREGNTSKDKLSKSNKKEQIGRSSFFDDTELVELLEDFENMRKQKKKPITPRARQILSEKLNKLSSDVVEQKQMVENAILNSWQTIYPLKPGEHKEGTDGFYKQEIKRLRGGYEPVRGYGRAFLEKYGDELHKKYYKRYKETYPENLPPIFGPKGTFK